MFRGSGRIAAAVLAAAGACGGTAHAGTNTVTFTTPGEHVFAVPPQVTALDVRLVGGAGGAAAGGAIGGQGARVSGLLEVGVPGAPAAGTDLFGYVGSDGSDGSGFGRPSGGGGGAPTVLRREPLGTTCTAFLLSGPETFAVAGAGGGAGSVTAGAQRLAPQGNGGDAGSDGTDGGLNVATGGSTAPAGGTGEAGGTNGQVTLCARGGTGGDGAGTERALGASIAGLQLGGDSGTGEGSGGGGGGGVVGGGGGGGSTVGVAGGGAGGTSSTNGLSATDPVATTADPPQLRVSWDDVVAPTLAITEVTRTHVLGTVSKGLGDPQAVTLRVDGPGVADDRTEPPVSVPVSDGVWGLAGPFADGTWTFTADASDGAGNAANQVSRTVTFVSAPAETCNGVDDDGDGLVDEGVTTRFFRDADGDGKGDPAVFVDACQQPAGHVTNADDDDDTPAPPAARFALGAFAQPIDDALNVANAGRAVPVKLRVTDADGRPVTTDPGLRLRSAQTTCSASGGDAVEAYADGPSAWVHKGDGVWQLDWKTLKAWAGTCREMTVDVVGDTAPARTARFSFR